MANSQLKPPKVFKKHSKKGENRSTCWRSLKWKIAILCCYSHRQKGSSLLHNLLILIVVFSQVYLLHRYGLHRGRKSADSSVLMQMKRSYPLQGATSQLQQFVEQQFGKNLENPFSYEEQQNPFQFPLANQQPLNNLVQLPELPNVVETNEINLQPSIAPVKEEAVESPAQAPELTVGVVQQKDSPLVPQQLGEPDQGANLNANRLESPKPLDSASEVIQNPPPAQPEVLPAVPEIPPVAPQVPQTQDLANAADPVQGLPNQEQAPNLFPKPAEASSLLRNHKFGTFLSLFTVRQPQREIKSSANPPNPMYEMDKSKLLIPVLPWGPAEQIRGFRESLLMGFFMNRTVCVPPFWRERSPSAFKMVGEGLPAGARIDVDELSKLVNVCSLEDVIAKCGKQFTSVMLGQNICSKYTRKRIAELEQRLSFDPIYTDEDCTLADGVKLSPPGFTEKMVKLQPKVEDVQQQFPVASDTCTLWLYPYINFIESEKKLLIPFLTRASPPEGKWLKDIIKYTKRPKYIHQIVNDFFELNSLDKSNYLAIRWDFEKDFSDSCEKKKDDFFCKLTSNSTEAIRGLTNYVKQYNQKKKLKGVYVSTNPDMHEKIFTTLTSVWKAEFDGLIPLFTRDDLSPCVEKVNCMGVDLADAVDTAEIELCYRSAAFLRAQYSIWSRTIDLERRATHVRSLADKLFTDIINK